MTTMDLLLVHVPAKPPITVWGSKLKRLEYLKGYKSHDFHWECYRHAAALDKRLASWYHSTNLFMNAAFTTNLVRFTEGMNFIMAGKRTSKPNNSERPEWKGFIDFTLSDGHLEVFDNMQIDHVATWEQVAGLLESGYRMTHSYNGNNKTFTATLIDNRNDSKTAGWALSAQSDEYRDAINILLYKHLIAMEGDWTEWVNPTRRAKRG